MGSDSELDEFSGDEIDDTSHAKLVANVSKLGKAQYVQKATRTEPTTKISEYDLVKSATGNKGKVNINDLTKGLTARSSQVAIQKRLKNVVQGGKTLAKPLEKPEAQKIRRTLGFQKAQEQLSRWDAVVTRNRISDNLQFPLPKNDMDEGLQSSSDLVAGFHLKSELQKEMDKLKPKEEIYEIEDKFPLSLEEITERRQEMAKLRAHQSYIEAKARRQGKIKSKKFHRVQRRERMKQQLKDFEELQKTNPEEALRKLEEIEKARAEERVSLRHKSTGKWAKSKLVRAKYDKETRQVLAQQLSISKELTHKVNVDNSSDSEIELEVSSEMTNGDNTNNPWVKTPVKTTQEIDEFVSGYRKFWEAKSKNVVEDDSEEKIATQSENNDEGIKENEKEETVKNDVSSVQNNKRDVEESNESLNIETREKKNTTRKLAKNTKKSKTDTQSIDKTRPSKVVKKTKIKDNVAGNFSVEENIDESQLSVTKSMDLNALFDGLSQKINQKIAEKMKGLKRSIDEVVPTEISSKKKKKRNKIRQKHKGTDLSFPTQAKRPEIDEELTTHVDDDNEDQEKIASFNKLVNLLKDKSEREKAPVANIDPNKFINVKPSRLETELPDIVNIDDENNEGDDDEENDLQKQQREMITAAFEDDDVVDEFSKDKKNTVDKDKIAPVDLNLPGWGSWGGKNLKTPQRKRKRFIIKFLHEQKRRDSKKSQLIVNENAVKKVKEHLVSELPYPFKTVKDFEASIRAPIGNTFVTERAHRKLTAPVVNTKMGTVIEPMDESELLRKKRRSQVKF